MKSLTIIALLAASFGLLMALEPACNLEWKAVSKGGCSHTIAIHKNGTLFGWGDNEYGQVGDGTSGENVTVANPKMISEDTTWVTVAAGCHHSMAIKKTGEDLELHTWGRNHHGQIGDGTTDDVHTPKKIGAAKNWLEVYSDATNSSFAINKDNELFAWGDNTYGQLGLGEAKVIEAQKEPVQVGTDKTWDSVSVGNSFAFGLQRMTLFAWGRNSQGQLGDGTKVDKFDPTKIDGTWSAVSAGNRNNAVGIKSNDGLLYGWGCDFWNCEHTEMHPLSETANWDTIYLGWTNGYGIKKDKTFWGYGQNGAGELGNGNTESVNVPTQISAGWDFVAGGDTFSKGLKNGVLYTWGFNDKNAFGYGEKNIFVNVPDVCSGDGVCSTEGACVACAKGTAKVDAKCEKCADGCAACKGSTTQCTECLDAFFLDGTTCKACDPSCAKCDGAADKCTACKTGFLDEKKHKCVDKCDDNCKACQETTTHCTDCYAGLFLEGTVCQDCSKSCKECKDTADKCTACKDGAWLNVDKCDKCAELCATCTDAAKCSTCKAGAWLNGDMCEKCSDSCASCKEAADKCTACKTGAWLNVDKCDPCADLCTACDGASDKCSGCKDGAFLNVDKCEPCAGLCTVCAGAADKCSACKDNAWLNVDKCEACSDSCLKCAGGADKCTACKDGAFVKDEKCEKCDESCATCETEAKTCKTCKAGAFLKDATCTPCKTGCATCADAADNCQTCTDGYFMKTTPAPTPAESANEDKKTCEKCNDKCTTCKDKAEFCTACKDGTTPTAAGECSSKPTPPEPTGCSGFWCPLPVILTIVGLIALAGGAFAFIRYRNNRRAPGEGLLDADNADYTDASKDISLEKLQKA